MRLQGQLSRRITVAVCAVALLLCVAPVPSRGADAKPIVIGTSVSLSGIFADGGKSSLEGYQLWIKLQNAKGGLLAGRWSSSTTTIRVKARPASGSTSALSMKITST